MSCSAVRRIIEPAKSPRPTSHYSHGLLVGPWLYTSGQTARDTEGKIVGEGSLALQMEQALRNLDLVLGEAGLGRSHLVALRVFLRRGANPNEAVQYLKAFLGAHAPAVTVCSIESLAYQEYLVEIEAIACKDDQWTLAAGG